MTKQKGFTLIELLIVIAIIAVLAAAAFVAVDPVGRIQDARNARRWSDVTAILDAILTYNVDNKAFPAAISATTNQLIGTSGSGCDTPCTAVTSVAAACSNLQTALVDKYIAAVPVDPGSTTTWNNAMTGYYVYKSANNRIKVGSCITETGTGASAPSIYVQR